MPVVGYRTDEFPSFYSRTSDHRAPLRADDVETLAAMMAAKWALGLEGGIVVANPVPEAEEMARADIDGLIGQALAECDTRASAAGHHALPVGPDRRTVRGTLVGDQHRVGPQQRPARCGARRRPRGIARLSSPSLPSLPFPHFPISQPSSYAAGPGPAWPTPRHTNWVGLCPVSRRAAVDAVRADLFMRTCSQGGLVSRRARLGA